MSVQLSMESDEPVARLLDLSDWLRQESELRGLVSFGDAVPGPGELGALTDVLMVAVGSGGTLSVLAASLQAFLSQRWRSEVRIVVTTADGARVELDAKRVDDVERLLRRALEGAA